MDFKELLATDLKTFINPLEFGEPIEIEGELVVVVMDADTLKEWQLAKDLEGDLRNEEILFYVEKSALSFYPRGGNIVMFDGARWKVREVQDSEGMLSVTAEMISG